jgi:phage tail sheath protein FI
MISTIENFLTQARVSGMLLGAKTLEAFFVNCDKSTMNQNYIDNGRINVLTGVAPVKAREFITFRINQTIQF